MVVDEFSTSVKKPQYCSCTLNYYSKIVLMIHRASIKTHYVITQVLEIIAVCINLPKHQSLLLVIKTCSLHYAKCLIWYRN